MVHQAAIGQPYSAFFLHSNQSFIQRPFQPSLSKPNFLFFSFLFSQFIGSFFCKGKRPLDWRWQFSDTIFLLLLLCSASLYVMLLHQKLGEKERERRVLSDFHYHPRLFLSLKSQKSQLRWWWWLEYLRQITRQHPVSGSVILSVGTCKFSMMAKRMRRNPFVTVPTQVQVQGRPAASASIESTQTSSKTYTIECKRF